MSLHEFIVPQGIITWLFVLTIVLSGLQVIKLSFQNHRLLGIVAVILATCHGLPVLFLNL